MKFYHALAVLSIVLLASCTPQYETTYSFVPPKDNKGRECANSCVTEKNRCINQCNQSLGVTDTASNIFSTLVNSGTENKPEKSDRVATCTAQCNESHRVCHENCGGKVIVNKKCVAHCPSDSKK